MKRQQEDQIILAQIESIKADHPFWGYRRVWAYLKYRQRQDINKKRIYRIMKEHNLLVKPNLRLRAKRDNQFNRSKPRVSRPNECWGYRHDKSNDSFLWWLYLVIVLDWHTKKIVGYSLSSHSKTDDWLNALNSACNNQFPEGVLSKQDNLYLISDNGLQPTSKRFMEACSVLEIKQIFTSYNNPKGNADTERVIRTIKEDFVWVREFSSPFEFAENFKEWVEDYNNDYPHSSLNYSTPSEYEKEHLLITNKF